MKVFAVFFLLLITISTAQSQTPASTDARALLRKMLDAQNSLPLTGTQTTTLPGAGASSVQRVWRDGGRAVRVDYLSPDTLAGEQMVDNGHLFWHYIPSRQTLEVGPSRLGRMRRRVPQIEQKLMHGDLTVQTQGQEIVAGRACTILDVSARGGSGPRRRFWIDPATGAQLAVTQFGRDGQKRSATRFSFVTLSPAFPKGTWQAPRTPVGTHVIALDNGPALPSVAAAQARVAYALLQPAFLPQGCTFQSASVSDFHGKQIASLRYGDGLNVLSLFEMPLSPNAPKNASGKIGHLRPGVLTAVQGRVRVILIGNAAPPDMERVLSSLR